MKQESKENKVFSLLSLGSLFGLGSLFSICCLSAATSAAASQGPRKVLPSFRGAVAQLRKVTRVPIAIPTNIPGKFQCFVYILTKNEYEVDLALPGSAHDDEANSFGAIGGRKIIGKRTASSSLYGTSNYEFGSDEKAAAQPVTLADGIRGYYVPQERDASLVFWHQGKCSYVAAWKASKSDVVQMANSAILNER